MKKFIDELIVYLLFIFCIALLLVIGTLEPVEYYSELPMVAAVELKEDEI